MASINIISSVHVHSALTPEQTSLENSRLVNQIAELFKAIFIERARKSFQKMKFRYEPHLAGLILPHLLTGITGHGALVKSLAAQGSILKTFLNEIKEIIQSLPKKHIVQRSLKVVRVKYPELSEDCKILKAVKTAWRLATADLSPAPENDFRYDFTRVNTRFLAINPYKLLADAAAKGYAEEVLLASKLIKQPTFNSGFLENMLIAALKNGHVNVFTILSQFKSITLIDESGAIKIFKTAIEEGYADIVTTLAHSPLAQQIGNSYVQEIFCTAIEEGRADIVKILADSPLANLINWYSTPDIFETAIQNGHANIVTILANSPVAELTNEFGATEILKAAIQKGRADIIVILVQSPLIAKKISAFGLHQLLKAATENDRADIVEILIGPSQIQTKELQSAVADANCSTRVTCNNTEIIRMMTEKQVQMGNLSDILLALFQKTLPILFAICLFKTLKLSYYAKTIISLSMALITYKIFLPGDLQRIFFMTQSIAYRCLPRWLALEWVVFKNNPWRIKPVTERPFTL